MNEHFKKLQADISKSSVPIDQELHNDFVKVFSDSDTKKLPPFIKLFWEEQQKYLNSSKQPIRYHSMIIRFCLNLTAKSTAGYEEIRYNKATGSGFVILPSRRRLRDYKNYIKPKRGFNKEIIKELMDKIKHFNDIERYCIITFDEMKIQENLVWDKYTGELIGFVDLGDLQLKLWNTRRYLRTCFPCYGIHN